MNEFAAHDPGEPLTRNMLSGAGPASPLLSHPSQQILSPIAPSVATVPGISGAYLDATHILNV